MTVNPLDNEELFNVIVLGGATSPGTVKISGHDREAKWDVKEGSGQSGATTTLKSKPPTTFTCVFTLTDAADIAAWPAFQAACEETINGKTPKAKDIYNPDLASQKITSVCLAKMGGAVHDGKGGQTRTVVFQEYMPPKKAGGTPFGSVTKKKDPNQDALDELARLTKQYQDTPWGSPKAA